MVSRSLYLLWSALAFGMPLLPISAQAQNAPKIESLQALFLAAWSKQPEAALNQLRKDAALAQEKLAQTWTPEPLALEGSVTNDRFIGNNGGRELEIGVSVPLWLPGEKQQQSVLAQAQTHALASRLLAAQLRLAANVREAWWNWQRARSDVGTATTQLSDANVLATDVAKRVKAGDLARADQHQALSAVASNEALLAQANASLSAASSLILALAGEAKLDGADIQSEPMPPVDRESLPGHAELQSFKDRAMIAQAQLDLIATQSRANPELKIATTRTRGGFADAYNQSVVVGFRLPLGSAPRQASRMAAARLELEEINAQLAFDSKRLASEISIARAKLTAAETLVDITERRARLANETKEFFEKSFRLGETDLPTRLRFTAEAAEAQRAATRSRVDRAAAVSAVRQALGQLPQ